MSRSTEGPPMFGNLDQEYGQVRLLIDMAVQEEVEIALDELVDKVECNVLGLPQPVLPVDIEFLLYEMTEKVQRMESHDQAVSGPYTVGQKSVYIPCDWFSPESAEYEGSC